MEIKACWCALPAMTGSTECCKNCTNRPSNLKPEDKYLPEVITLDRTEMNLCSSCRHYMCLVNQGVWGCMKNHDNSKLVKKCEDYSNCGVYTNQSTVTTTDVKLIYNSEETES